jgi:hypothetical protein
LTLLLLILLQNFQHASNGLGGFGKGTVLHDLCQSAVLN